MNFKELKTQRTLEVDAIITRYLPKEAGYQKTIMEAMNYSVMAGGKRLRPMLMRETYRLFGGEGDEINPFMAAIEMIHTSSLVHDDLPCMDADEYRRGRKTTWVMYGEDMAVLAGDALLIFAIETASKAFSMSQQAVLVGKCIQVLANKTGIFGMIGGQTVDVELTNRAIPRDKLEFIYRLKTGALLEASMMIGAILGGAGDEELSVVEQIAANVGFAFQIQDDILDITSSQEVLGKPVLSDEKNHKTTYVTLEGMEQAKKQVEEISQKAIEGLKSLSGKNPFLEALLLMLITREK